MIVDCLVARTLADRVPPATSAISPIMLPGPITPTRASPPPGSALNASNSPSIRKQALVAGSPSS
jgi:hypothetical protein